MPTTLQAKSVASSSTQTTSVGAELPSSLAEDKKATTTSVSAHHTDPHDTVKLSFDLIEHLNLGDLLERTNEVTVPPVFPASLSDSGNSDSEDSGNSLMEELVRLSKKQQNSAAPEPISPIEHHSPRSSENVKNKTHDVGVMSGPCVASTGVTACLDPSSRSKDTVFLDLRKLEKETPQVIDLVIIIPLKHVYILTV